MNPVDTIKNMIGKMTPEQIIMNITGGNNQMINNLIKMGKEGNSQAVETFARNLFKEQGRDFDTEFSQFKEMFK